MGVIVGILALLVTVLVGWQIWSTIDIKNEQEVSRRRIKDYNSKIIELNEKIGREIEHLSNKQSYFQNYGYAVTDFCQVFTRLDTEKKDFFKVYCKALNALRNFLKTDESMDWYAPACIDNMREALRLAREKGESCNHETQDKIKEYINEIRKCPLIGFEKYWKEILKLEDERERG